jgi:hypothetical protein
MGSFHSFAQVLEKKIRREIEKEYSRSDSVSSTETPSEGWTRLVGEMSTYHFQASQQAQAYHRHRPVSKPRPAHNLNEDQQHAWAFFQSHLELPLAPNYSKADLQRAFRSLALRLHPDQGGSSSKFQELLKARRQLETIFHR